MVLGLCLWLVWPAQALGRALVRFLHAVPGAGTATVAITSGSGTTVLGTIGFGQSTRWRSIRSGSFDWRLSGSGGSGLAQGTATVGNGAYDIIVLDRVHGVGLGIYRDRGGEPGTSLVRMIHAAPELGGPELELDSQIVAQRLDFTHATAYLSVSPGVHALAAMRPGDSTPLVSVTGLKLVPGVAYSAIVVGSRGQRVRVVTVTDRGAPLTRAAPLPGQPQPASGSDTGWMTVQHGDSLWQIARTQLGEHASSAEVESEMIAIWNANVRRIGTGDPNLIFPGQRLHVPTT